MQAAGWEELVAVLAAESGGQALRSDLPVEACGVARIWEIEREQEEEVRAQREDAQAAAWCGSLSTALQQPPRKRSPHRQSRR